MELDYICSQTIAIIHCCITQISSEGRIIKTYGSISQENHPLCTDDFFVRRLVEKVRECSYYVYHEFEKVVYIVFKMNESEDCFVIGPVSLEKKTDKLTEMIKKEHHMNTDNLFRLAYCDMRTLGSSALILMNLMNGEKISLEEFWKEKELEKSDVEGLNEQISKEIFLRQEISIPHNPYDQEVRELASIRHGDTEMLKASLTETYYGREGRLAEDEVRHAQNMALVVLTLASRAAIDGGMSPEESFCIMDAYVGTIESMQNPAKIRAVMRQAEFDYTERVKRIEQKRTENIFVEYSKNYIFQHLHDSIIISDISKKIGVNTSYLSRIFHKIEGVTIQQYIIREKIRLAENMLRYSAYDLKEIAQYLSFCSQSHFGEIFRKQTGLTPAVYRKKYMKFTAGKSKIYDKL